MAIRGRSGGHHKPRLHVALNLGSNPFRVKLTRVRVKALIQIPIRIK